MKNEFELAQPDMLPPEKNLPARADAFSVGAALGRIVERGVTADSAVAIEKLAAVFERERALEAERAFNADFVRIQSEIPTIRATHAIPGRDGTVRFMAASFDDIDAEARPVCARHGFAYTFTEGESVSGQVEVICTLLHVGGHSRSSRCRVSVGGGPPGCSPAQACGAAHSYAKRIALCHLLNIRIDRALESDPRADTGERVTAAQADELERRVNELGISGEKFLQWAGADMTAQRRWETIPAARYSECDSVLKKREASK